MVRTILPKVYTRPNGDQYNLGEHQSAMLRSIFQPIDVFIHWNHSDTHRFDVWVDRRSLFVRALKLTMTVSPSWGWQRRGKERISYERESYTDAGP